jgi:arylsulfatase
LKSESLGVRWLAGALAGGCSALIVAKLAALAVSWIFREDLPVPGLSFTPWIVRLIVIVTLATACFGLILSVAAALAIRRARDVGRFVAGLLALLLVARATIGPLSLLGAILCAIVAAALLALLGGAVGSWVASRVGYAATALAALLAVCVVTLGLVQAPSRSLAAGTLDPEATPSALWPPDRPRPKHVLLIVIDTLRADHLSCYGYERATSPEIDRLASQGARFAWPSVQYTMTSPSMASILTGTYPTTHNLVSCRTILPALSRTLAESLLEHGLKTSAVVSNPNLARGFQFDQGFVDYDEQFGEGGKMPGSVVTDRALAWLQRHDGSPFFLYVHYLDPHSKYEPPPPFRGRFETDQFTARHAQVKLSIRRNGKGEIPEDAVIENGATDADLYVARYDEEILTVDHEVGRLLEGLTRAGLADDTAVILTADHGESLLEHEIYFNHGKQTYEDVARVPLIVRWPKGVTAGAVVDQPVESIDLAPTILDMLGAPLHGTLEGRSLVSLLLGTSAWEPKPVRVEAGHGAKRASVSWREGNWKLIYNDAGWSADELMSPEFLLSPKRWQRLWWASTGRQPYHLRWELYDLASDPRELNNRILVDRAQFDRLAPRLLAWRAKMPAERTMESDLDQIDPEIRKQLESLGYAH